MTKQADSIRCAYCGRRFLVTGHGMDPRHAEYAKVEITGAYVVGPQWRSTWGPLVCSTGDCYTAYRALQACEAVGS